MFGFGDKVERGIIPEAIKEEAINRPELEKILYNLFSDDYGQSNIDNNSEPETEDSVGIDSPDSDDKFDLKSIYKPNSTFEHNGNIYETDDNGNIYKINGNELTPDTEYTINGVTYTTDSNGRIISCDGLPKQTPEGIRDTRAQEQAGGEDRQEGDQGGHILARILGGSKGIENMLAMRGPINQGPYHSMEKEIDKALSDGKDVHIHVDVKYKGDSERPSKIIVTYSIDGKVTVIEYDNDAGSTDLLESVENNVDNVQYADLKQEIKDANEDGANMSIIAVKIEYDDEGNTSKVTVVMRDENSGGPNEKRVLLPKEDE